MAKRDYFELNVNAPIFNELSKLPTWWQLICNDKDLYVNIRKDSRVYVYYKGSAVIGDLRSKKCKIHVKYLDKSKSIWSKAGDKGYFSTTPEKIMNDIRDIKKNIREHINTDNYEGKCEKEIQGDKYINDKEYIDTEYAYRYQNKTKEIVDKNGKKKQIPLTIRIDMVSITKDGLIEFVELKRISDDRLLTEEYRSNPRKKIMDKIKQQKLEGKDPEPPEILQQMRDYKEFIKEHKDDILDYYNKVQKIMANIGVNHPLKDRKIKGVKPNVRLWFANYKDGSRFTEDRMTRIKDIRNLLETHKIESNIKDVLISYEKRRPNK